MTGANLTIEYSVHPLTEKEKHWIRDVEGSYEVPAGSLIKYILKAARRSTRFTVNEGKDEVTFSFERLRSDETIALKRSDSQEIITEILKQIKERVKK